MTDSQLLKAVEEVEEMDLHQQEHCKYISLYLKVDI